MGTLWMSLPTNLNSQAIQNFGGGLNVGAPSFDIQENQTTDEMGWDTDQQPSLHTRKGKTPYGSAQSGRVTLITNYETNGLICGIGTQLYKDDGSGNLTSIFTSAVSNDWEATNFNGKLLLTNGNDNIKSWDGTTLSDLSTSAPNGAKHITNDTIRVWAAKGDILYYSAYLTQTDWTTAENSGSVEYYTSNGGDITALRNFADHIMVFKKDSFAEIYGTDYYNFRMIENSDNVGCVDHKTIQEVGTYLYWLSFNDVYAYFGGKPFPIGQPIRKYLDAINTAQYANCMSGTDGIRYYLGLVTGTNTYVDTWLIYDPRYQQWRVSDKNNNFTCSFYWAYQNTWYAGNSSGQLYKLNQGTSDNGTAINWSVTSKPFDESYPDREKEYYEMHVQAYVPSGSTLTLSVSTRDIDLNDGNDWTQVFTATSNSETQRMDVIIPLDTVPITNWFRFKLSGTGEVSIHNITRYFRVQPLQI